MNIFRLGCHFLHRSERVVCVWLQELVDQLKKGAYAKLDKLPEDHVMTDNSPNPIHVDKYTSNGAGPSYMTNEQQNCSVRLTSVHG